MHRHLGFVLAVLVLLVLPAVPSCAAANDTVVRVVTTLPAYAAITAEVGGERVAVEAISRCDEDAHFVKPKPSFAMMLKTADLFVTTGLDLEIWAPTLIDKSGNRQIREGAPGWVSASAGVPLLDVPEAVDRSAGDVHVYGNPHVFTSPLNAKVIAGNVAAGLGRIDPDGAASYAANLAAFRQRIDAALYGERLVELLGAETLDPLARDGRLLDFLATQDYQGKPLTDLLGGWFGQVRELAGRKIVAYHKNWIYFTDLFGLDVVDYVEPKPGIPPSARHVHELTTTVRRENVSILLAASYFGEQNVGKIAERLKVCPVLVDLGPGDDGPRDYIGLVDLWVTELRGPCRS
jgi:ABC-type Zn uptake system ZnuABC Zn-binding protein ZnuA